MFHSSLFLPWDLATGGLFACFIYSTRSSKRGKCWLGTGCGWLPPVGATNPHEGGLGVVGAPPAPLPFAAYVKKNKIKSQ